jgi:hypothetical protein
MFLPLGLLLLGVGLILRTLGEYLEWRESRGRRIHWDRKNKIVDVNDYRIE